MNRKIVLLLIAGMIILFHSTCFALDSTNSNDLKKINTPANSELSSPKKASDSIDNSLKSEAAEKNALDIKKESEADNKVNFKYTIMTENFPPFNYEEKGKVTGIATEIIQEMFFRLGIKDIPIKVMDWDKAYQVALEKPDSIIFSLTKIAERRNKFKWVGPIATNYWYLFARKQPVEGGNNNFIKVSSLKNAKQYKIGVQEQGAICQYLQSKGFENLIESKTNEQAAENLLNGTVQLWGESELAAASLLRQLNKNPNIIRKAFKLRKHNLYIGFNINTPDSEIDKLQAVLDQMKNDGDYDKIVNKYYNRLYLETIKEGETENVHPKKYTQNN